MRSTYQSVVVKAPIDQVWATVRDFHDFSWADRVVSQCDAVGDKSGTEVGARRVLNDAFHETLLEHDDRAHRMRYSIDDGPSPLSPAEVRNYVGELHLIPATIDNATFVEWRSTWESVNDEAEAFCHGLYVSLLEALAQRFNRPRSLEEEGGGSKETGNRSGSS